MQVFLPPVVWPRVGRHGTPLLPSRCAALRGADAEPPRGAGGPDCRMRGRPDRVGTGPIGGKRLHSDEPSVTIEALVGKTFPQREV